MGLKSILNPPSRAKRFEDWQKVPLPLSPSKRRSFVRPRPSSPFPCPRPRPYLALGQPSRLARLLSSRLDFRDGYFGYLDWENCSVCSCHVSRCLVRVRGFFFFFRERINFSLRFFFFERFVTFLYYFVRMNRLVLLQTLFFPYFFERERMIITLRK